MIEHNDFVCVYQFYILKPISKTEGVLNSTAFFIYDFN